MAISTNFCMKTSCSFHLLLLGLLSAQCTASTNSPVPRAHHTLSSVGQVSMSPQSAHDVLKTAKIGLPPLWSTAQDTAYQAHMAQAFQQALLTYDVDAFEALLVLGKSLSLEHPCTVPDNTFHPCTGILPNTVGNLVLLLAADAHRGLGTPFYIVNAPINGHMGHVWREQRVERLLQLTLQHLVSARPGLHLSPKELTTALQHPQLAHALGAQLPVPITDLIAAYTYAPTGAPTHATLQRLAQAARYHFGFVAPGGPTGTEHPGSIARRQAKRECYGQLFHAYKVYRKAREQQVRRYPLGTIGLCLQKERLSWQAYARCTPICRFLKYQAMGLLAGSVIWSRISYGAYRVTTSPKKRKIIKCIGYFGPAWGFISHFGWFCYEAWWKRYRNPSYIPFRDIQVTVSTNDLHYHF